MLLKLLNVPSSMYKAVHVGTIDNKVHAKSQEYVDTLARKRENYFKHLKVIFEVSFQILKVFVLQWKIIQLVDHDHHYSQHSPHFNWQKGNPSVIRKSWL